MATNNDIRYCLESNLFSLSTLPAGFAENLNNYPQDPVSHITTKFVPTSRRAVTVGDNPYTDKRGYFRVTIRTPLNYGVGEGLSYADQIEGFFGPGKSFTVAKTGTSLQMDFTANLYSFDNTTTTVVIDYSETSGSYEESPYYCTPVVIGWHCNNL